MKWERREARRGDIVRVPLGLIFHYGIFVSQEEVIQFGLPPHPGRDSSKVEVLSAPLSAFLEGGVLEVGECEEGDPPRRSPEETVAAAKSRLGERGYNIIHNNCEHFANECAFGVHVSTMTDGLRMKYRAVPMVHVYVARFPFPVEGEEIVPVLRREEIEACSNAHVRAQKYYSWKLLEGALMRSLGLRMEKLNFTRSKGGKWECGECFFSLSHCGDIAVAAVSRRPVGVDIELRDEARFTPRLAEKIATEGEKELLGRTEEGARARLVNVLWTKKEALFKLGGGERFCPAEIGTEGASTATREIACGGERYFVTVASEDAARADFRLAEGLDLLPT